MSVAAAAAAATVAGLGVENGGGATADGVAVEGDDADDATFERSRAVRAAAPPPPPSPSDGGLTDRLTSIAAWAVGSASAAAKELESEVVARRAELRGTVKAEGRAQRFATFGSELRMLGLDPGDVPSLTERALRDAFRKRSRQLHPDLQAARRAEAEAAAAGDDVDVAQPQGQATDGAPGAKNAADVESEPEPTIYELNEAYESLRKLLRMINY